MRILNRWSSGMSHGNRPAHNLVVLLIIGGLTGCQKDESASGAGASRGMPPVRAVLWEVTPTQFSVQERFIGSIDAREMIEVQSEIQGVIRSIEFQEGEAVEADHILVHLDDTKLIAQLDQVQADLEQFQMDFEMDEKLYSENTISKQAHDQTVARLKRAEAQMDLRRRELADTTIRAPFSGVVGERNISIGQVVNPQTSLTFLVMLDPIDIEFQLPERFVSKISVGQKLGVRVRAWPEDRFEGEVHFIASYVDTGTRTVQVKAKLNNDHRKLKPGMFGEVFLAMETFDQAMLIPEPALFRILNSREASLYRVTADNKVEMVTVVTGKRLAGVVQILSGLEIGDKVIVEGTQKAIPGADVIPAPADSLAPYQSMMDEILRQGAK